MARWFCSAKNAFNVNAVKAELAQNPKGDPPPMDWSTLRYVFGHEKEERDAEKEADDYLNPSQPAPR